MVRIIRHFPIHRPNDSDNDPLLDEEKPPSSSTVEDTIDDLLAGLTHRPDIASHQAASAQAASPQAMSNEPALARLPSVEEFRFDEAAAKSMASRLAPIKKPRIKSRRPRYRRLNRDRWRLPHTYDERHEHDDGQNAGNQDLPTAPAATRGGGRGLIWSFCASILIVTGTSAAFGIVQPLNDLLPERMGDFLGGLSGGLGASLFSGADTSADFEVADGSTNPDKAVLIPGQPVQAAIVARAVPTTTITAEVTSPVKRGDVGFAAQAAPAVAAAGQAYGVGVAALERARVYGVSAERATPEPVTPARISAVTRVANPARAGAAPDAENEDSVRRPALQRSAKADPLPAPDTPAIMREPVPGAAPPAASSLSPARIDRLLARGQELLQSGDIASARLAFERVAAAGDRRGARGVGMTYDPRVYARLPVAGLTPDRAQAEFWYTKAGGTVTFAVGSNTMAGTPKSQVSGSPEWNAACALKYTSFEPGTGLYTAHSGAKRPCRLP